LSVKIDIDADALESGRAASVVDDLVCRAQALRSLGVTELMIGFDEVRLESKSLLHDRIDWFAEVVLPHLRALP
jgi:hypothetical protein